MRSIKLNAVLILLLLAGFCFAGCSGDDSSSDDAPGSDSKEITSFIFAATDNALSEDVTAEISGNDITAALPPATDLGSLIATFSTTGVSVSVGVTVQESGVTANNFSSAVEYTVTAEDGSTAVYTVTASIAEAEVSVSLKDFVHASDMKASDYFGSSIAVSGNYAIVGAYYEDGGEGDPFYNTGAAYIFEKDSNGNWEEKQILRAPDSIIASGINFGSCVAINGDYAAVSAIELTPNSPVVIYKRNSDSGQWEYQQTFAETDSADTMGYGIYYGTSIAISGDYMFVASYGSLWGTFFGYTVTPGVYVYKLESGTWTKTDFLQPDDSDIEYGAFALSTDGSTLVIGSYSDDETYIYEINSDGTCTFKQTLTSTTVESEDYFGKSVSINGDYIFVGASQDDGDDSGDYNWSGAVYVFKYNSETNSWEEKQVLRASDPAYYDQIGTSVSVYGDYAVIGVPNKYAEGVIVSEGFGAGCIYVFKYDLDSERWIQKKKIQTDSYNGSDYFGSQVVITDDEIFVGSYQEDGGDDNTTTDAGAIYIYEYSVE
ncbi:MAG: hypothetical protein JW864_18025 [Spirochaetes bacterium]|nr:hypothetical protein [Spirochaetota bacterium]